VNTIISSSLLLFFFFPLLFLIFFFFVFPNIGLIQGHSKDIESAIKTAKYVFRSLSESDVANVISRCLETVHSERVGVATGYFSFLLRFFKMKRGTENVSLPIILNLLLFKLGHDLSIHRMQAHLALNVMAESGYLSRHYISSADSVVDASYSSFQNAMSSQMASDYKDVTLEFWRVGYRRLAQVTSGHRRSVLWYFLLLFFFFFSISIFFFLSFFILFFFFSKF
jgi:hypothetical protein